MYIISKTMRKGCSYFWLGLAFEGFKFQLIWKSFEVSAHSKFSQKSAMLCLKYCLVKFGLSEKHTKICAIFLMLWTYQEDFFKFCVFLRKSELYSEQKLVDFLRGLIVEMMHIFAFLYSTVSSGDNFSFFSITYHLSLSHLYLCKFQILYSLRRKKGSFQQRQKLA